MKLATEHARPAFTVPAGLVATAPPEASGTPRDGVGMLVSSPGSQEHHLARELPAVLRRGDLVVVNDSQTLPAALAGYDGDEEVELHLSTLDPNTAAGMDLALAAAASRWVVEVRAPLPVGSRPALDDRRGHVLSLAGGATATIERSEPPAAERSRLWLAAVWTPGPLGAHLERWGEPIRYDYAAQRWPIESYRTDVGRRPGSAEMPSAARPLTPAVLSGLEKRGVEVATVTLHTGVSSLESGEAPYPEWRQVPRATARAIRQARRRGGRVLAVGTTVVRALESAAGEPGQARPTSGWTSLVVEPSHPVQTVDAILTGWHEPEATHLLMLEAIAGPALLERSYTEALRAGYRWHEFGDVHLLWRDHS